MELLYELESQADELIVELMRRTIADALSQYKPMCEECDVAMARHHSYERTLITKYGEMRLDVPVFRCGDCGAMTSGMDVIGKGQARKRYSKKIRDEAGGAGNQLRARGQDVWLCQEYAVQVVKAGRIQASKPVGRGIGTGRDMDAGRGREVGVEGSA